MENKNIKILAIGDSPKALFVLKEIIKNAYPEVKYITVSPCNSGVDLCHAEKPDIILIDLVMPGMYGIEVCSRIKSDFRLKSIPVIMVMSTRAGKESRLKALEAGADAFLHKPVDESELRVQVRAMLVIKEAEDLKKKEKQLLRDMVLERTEGLEKELADQKKAEETLTRSLDKVNKNKKAILNLMEDLKSEIGERKLAEKELQDERNLLRTLIDKIPFPIYVMDINGRKVIANKADVENICCSTESEVIGKTDLELFPGEVGIRGYADSMSVIQTGKPLIDLEEKFINNGIQRWLLTSQYPLNNMNGQIKGLVGIGYEITERKKAEDNMRHSHYLMSYIIEHSNSAIAVHDRELNYIYVSKSYLKDYNISDQNIIGKNHYEVFPDIPQKWKDVHQKGLQGIVSSADEDLFIREDGSEWWTRWECRPWHDSEGLIGGIIIYTEVITERKNMEKKIIESEAYYRALIDLSPDGIIIADYEGTISYVSKKALEILNVPNGLVITGSSILNFFASDSVESIISRVSDILIGNLMPETREYKLKKYDGPMFWGELSSSLLKDSNGSPSALMIIFRDISERKSVESDLIKSREKAVESDRLKTAFLHNISHEIRTPMNAIIGFASLLNETEPDSLSQKPLINVIIQSSNHLLAIVSDIIEISNIEAGLTKVTVCEVKLNEIVRNLYEQYELNASEKGIILKLETGLPDVVTTIRSDKTKLIQVLSYLLGNAIKFTSEGEIIFGYVIKKNQIEFFVSDTGIGIPAEQHNKVFERFYQVENSFAKQYDGTGLGLPISKAYVEMLGGKMWMTSLPGKGSVFYFTIPSVLPN